MEQSTGSHQTNPNDTSCSAAKETGFLFQDNPFSKQDIASRYKDYCRPQLGGLLQAIRMDIPYHRAKGDFLYYNKNGQEIEVTDFLGGFGASLFGHNHPELASVAKSNHEKELPFNTQLSCRSYSALLAEKLNQLLHRQTGREYITTFANSGAEAVEAAIKHAELQQQKQVEKIHKQSKERELELTEKYKNGKLEISDQFFRLAQERLNLHPGSDIFKYLWALKNHNFRIFKIAPRFISLKRSFHGKSSGAVKLTHNPDFRLPFERIGLNVLFIDPDNIEELEQAVEKSRITYFWPEVDEHNQIVLTEKAFVNISALFIEPLQGEGGIYPMREDFLQTCREVATKHRIPLIFDEIQCGMGRTGTFLFCEQLNVNPDYVLLSKSLGGGLAKISAMLTDSEMYEPDFGLIHSSTFAEDEHSSRIALAGLGLLEQDNLMQECSKTGEYLKQGLARIQEKYPDIIEQVRGSGLMLGIQFHDPTRTGSLTLKILGNQGLFGFIVSGYLLHEHNIRVATSLSHSRTMRIEPSAYISVEACDNLFEALERLCEILHKQNMFELCKYIIDQETPGQFGRIENCRKPYTPYQRPKNSRKVALLTHIILPEHLRLFDDSFSQMSHEQCCKFIDRVYPFIRPEIFEHFLIESYTGERVDLCWIGIFVDSRNIAAHMMQNDIKPIQDKVEDAVQLATDNGYTVIGFGGFTSIITRNCTNIKTDSISLTSGN
ncbi:MAG: aminotransferase class III-fold pyridoxal phosphate-dependent enzyme, partial [Thermodesulfobacteriota bacterium]